MNPWTAGVDLAVLGAASATVSVVGGAARWMLTADNMLCRVTSRIRLLGVGWADVVARSDTKPRMTRREASAVTANQ